MMANVNKFQLKKAEMEILEALNQVIEEKLRSARTNYSKTGKTKQETDWRSGELLWEDEEKTIPKMTDIWDYVDVPDDELTAEQVATIMACESLRKDLESLI
jgi:hypothetical protein